MAMKDVNEMKSEEKISESDSLQEGRVRCPDSLSRAQENSEAS